MKGLAKKIWAIVLSVVLVAGVIPTTVFAENTYGVLATGYHEYYPTTDDYNSLDNTRAEDGHGTVVLTDEHPTAVDENVWTKYNGGYGGGSPKGYSNFTVFNSDPEVATVSIQPKTIDGHGAMDITFTKGSKESSTKITIDFFIDGLSVEWGIATDDDYSLLSGQIVYNVNNGEGGSGETDKPSKPTLNDVPANDKNGHVLVKCVTYPNTDPAHTYGDKTHAGYISLANSTDGWSFSEVVANDGSDPNAPIASFPWMCKLILDANWYVDLYNKNFADSIGTHYLASSDEVYARFYWNAQRQAWYYEDNDMPLVVRTNHTPSAKYTVTYTDGVDDEEVFADQVYSDLLAGTTTPAFNGTPKRDGYVFKGWDPEVAETVTSNAVYKATWGEDKNNIGVDDKEETKYTVTYTDGVDNEEVFADQVYSDLLAGTTTPAFSGTPKRDGYVFKGWDPEVAEKVTGNATYKAVWGEDKNNNGVDDKEETKYTVTYTDGVDDEEVFADQVYTDLLAGTMTPAFNGTPKRDGYVFKGWDPEVAEKVTGNATYKAVWGEDKNNNGIEDAKEGKYTVTYTDGVDNAEVFADQVYTDLLAGTTTPAFNGTPKRDGYEFKGWDPEVAEKVTGNATYVATWEKINNNQPNDTKTPQTGDTNNIMLPIVLLVVSFVGMTGLMASFRKKKS